MADLQLKEKSIVFAILEKNVAGIRPQAKA